MSKFKKIYLTLLCVMLALCISIALVACKDKDTGENTVEEFSTYLTAMANTTADKTYAVKVNIEEEGMAFSNADKANFAIEAVDAYDTSSVRNIAEFNLEKVSDTELDVTFADTEYLADGDSWRLYSTVPVMSDGSKLECVIYLGSVSYGLVSENGDINRYNDNIVLTIALTEGTLVDTLTKENIEVSGALYEKDYTLTRVNNTTFSLTFEDAFKEDVSTLTNTTVTLLASGIKGNTPFDVFMDFSIITPSAEIDSSAIQFIPVAGGTKVIVPVILSDDFLTVINKADVSIMKKNNEPNADFVVVGVDVIGDNFMIVTLQSGLNVEDSAECLESLSASDLEIKKDAVNLGGEKASIEFGSFRSGIQVAASCNYTDEGFDGYVLNIKAINGSFDYENIKATDIQIKQADDETAYDFTLTSKSEKMLVVKINTDEETLAGSVTMNGTLINSRFGLVAAKPKGAFSTAYIEDDKSFVAFVLPYLKNLAESALSAAGEQIGAAITPHILNFLGLAPNEPQVTLKDINDSVSKLGAQLYNLEQQITDATNSLQRQINDAYYTNILNDYNDECNTLTYYVLNAYGDQQGLAKMLKMEKEQCYVNGKFSAEKFATLQNNAEYKAAKEVFKNDFEKRDQVFFAAKVKTFGDNLKAKGVGTNNGYFFAYWGLVEGCYLWDVQTIPFKEQFLNAAATAYCLSMTAVLRYMEITKNGALGMYKSSFADISKVIENYNNNLEASKRRRSTGKTLEYSTGKTISMDIGVYKAEYGDGYSTNLKSVINRRDPGDSALTDDNFKTILATAKVKKVEFSKSLRDAGFRNAPASSIDSIRIGIKQSKVSSKIEMFVPTREYDIGYRTVVKKTTIGDKYEYKLDYVTYTASKKSLSGKETITIATERTDTARNIRMISYDDTTNTYYIFKG